MNLLSEFVNHFYDFKGTEDLLQTHGYSHNALKHGYLGGANVVPSGKFFDLDESGEFMVIQPVFTGHIPTALNPVEEPIIADLIAWHPRDPRKWYCLRGECGLVLGEFAYFESLMFDAPLQLHKTPLDWLKAGSSGVVLLDKDSIRRLYLRGTEVICPDLKYGTFIKDQLHAPYTRNMPTLTIPAEINQ